MGSGFRRHVARLGTVGITLTTSALLLLPSTAFAEGEVVVGECDATLKGEDGKPLTVDLGAAVNQPGLLDLGLGSDSGALLSLPVKEALDGLGLSSADVLVNPLGEVCDVTQDTVNTLAAPVQEVLPNPQEEAPEAPEAPAPDDPAPGEPEPGEPEPEQPAPGNPDAPGAPGSDGDSGPGGATGSDGGDGAFLPSPGETVAIEGFAPLGPISIPPIAELPPMAPPIAPGAGQPDAGKVPDVTAMRDSGTVEALPAPDSPDRLPLLLAVVALVLVIAGLARTWLRRKAT
ncbi:hypothetical protein [Prauserella cavernicola]|uniref:LPXTG cell wall anchor domain-containing protein n=1 Tax=Prauserella cavernicola TaxID=2800127 RepID=A0A934QS03_9PSEU|nr:hypothetical protein [Prauserella cavernicola]MBK1784624.1 hypothetical protein [Prauserella cavernicola]